MLVLNESDIKKIGIDWTALVDVIEEAVLCMNDKDFAQPLKPYLRFRNPKNRIIAMPAFLGGNFNKAGIKWIASFPGNIQNGIPRAHSVVILNDADTGEPLAVINTALLSIIRTASVSGLVIKHFKKTRELANIRIGITGMGPIGYNHLKMCMGLLGDRISKISVYDIRPVNPALFEGDDRVEIVSDWTKAYEDADIFITCTVSDAAYIDQQPKPGSLHLNVSLRDYKTTVYPWFKDAMLVDDWTEVCREKTDIEHMHLQCGLTEADTRSVIDIVKNDVLACFKPNQPVMFNPMGMAIFDIAIATHYYNLGITTGAGTLVDN
ncbi:MAG: 2,3-diaminopropionate biosynthesis protein SbnB [Ferruginibacter sp.]|nr:2,3-diaminopropionate biosynthesis protein SbnB [Ferruginibacter sp.]